MQHKTTRRWPFTKKGSTISTAEQMKRSVGDYQSWSIYQSITELPLSRWIDLTVDGYLKALIKEGIPPENELHRAENELRIQYADAIGDGEYRVYVGVIKEITDMELILSQVHSLVRTLKDVYIPLFVKQLNSLLKTSFVFDVNKPEEYDKLLSRCINRSKIYNLRIDLKKIELEKLETKYKGKSGKATREYYMGLLISLSDHAGYPITDNISVYEFCERIKRANKINELQNLKQKKWPKI